MKKALILSCSTGQGHNSCARAVKEYFDRKQVDCTVVDAFRFVSENGYVLEKHGLKVSGLFIP